MRATFQRHGHRLWRSLAMLVFSTLVARAQLYTGSIAGVVLDPSNAPVMGAGVTLIDTDRNSRAELKTDGSGRYLFRALSPGNYWLAVEATGFDLFQVTVSIEVNASLSTDARLQLASRRESVLVQDPPPQINVENATVGL